MTAVAARTPAPRAIGARVWAAVAAAWAVVTGAAPHVLHHVGPLAGAAVLSGMGGKAIFFAIGLVLSVPTLRKLYRRFRTVVALALAILAFAGLFAFSSEVVAPRLTRSEKSPAPPVQTRKQPDHAAHHARTP